MCISAKQNCRLETAGSAGLPEVVMAESGDGHNTQQHTGDNLHITCPVPIHAHAILDNGLNRLHALRSIFGLHFHGRGHAAVAATEQDRVESCDHGAYHQGSTGEDCGYDRFIPIKGVIDGALLIDIAFAAKRGTKLCKVVNRSMAEIGKDEDQTPNEVLARPRNAGCKKADQKTEPVEQMRKQTREPNRRRISHEGPCWPVQNHNDQ
mmetsp:Transcript_74966/g.119114  ORF Transcript_74966/g.119114 Transcript_74966/m.119114 type:complete len:208 (-) Transcript_74966:403-1026(-)